MKQQKQSGFAHLMIITVILGLGVVGLLGVVFYQNLSQKKAVVSKTDNSPKVTEESNDKPVDKDSASKDVNEGYIVLSDWGVKFKLPSNLGSDTITYKKTSSTTYKDGYSFSTSSVDAVGGACAVSGVGWISRYADTSNLPVNVGAYITKIDNYSYYSLMSMADCSDGSSSAPASAYPIIRNLLLSVEKE